MKRHIDISLGIIGFIFIFYIIFSCGKVPSREDLYGVWKGDYHGKELLLKFNNDNSCILHFKDYSSGFVETINGNFELDFSKKPIPLTIRSIPQLNHPLYTIIEFINDNSIRMADFAPRWRIRPISFGYNKIIYLKRDK